MKQWSSFLIVVVTVLVMGTIITLLIFLNLAQEDFILYVPLVVAGLMFAVVMQVQIDKALLFFLFLLPILHFGDIWGVAGAVLLISLVFGILTKKLPSSLILNTPLTWAIIGFNVIVAYANYRANTGQFLILTHHQVAPEITSDGLLLSTYVNYYSVTLVLYLVLVVGLHTRELLLRGVWYLVVSGAIAALFGLMEGLFGIGIFSGDETRVQAFFKTPVDYAIYLQTSIPLLLALFWEEIEDGKRKFNGWTLIILLFGWTYGILRTSLVAFAVMLLFGLPVLLKRYQVKHIILYISPIILLLLILRGSLLFTTVETINSEIASPTGTNFGFRITQLRAGWEVIKTYPWFGVGISQAASPLAYFAVAIDPFYVPADVGLIIHTFFIRVAIESGVIGLLFYLLIIVLTLKELSYLPRAFEALGDRQLSVLAWGVRIAFIGYLILSLTHPADLYPVFWILIAFTASLRRILTRQITIEYSKAYENYQFQVS